MHYLELLQVYPEVRIAVPLSPLPLIHETDQKGITLIKHSGCVTTVAISYDDVMSKINAALSADRLGPSEIFEGTRDALEELGASLCGQSKSVD